MKRHAIKAVITTSIVIFSGLFFYQQTEARKPKHIKFPENFHWCTASSAHQIEGNNVNSDWWDWEQTPGKIKNGDVSGAATDHWNRVEEDTKLIKNLNLTRYRFSIEWAKIEPQPGVWDWSAVEHYRDEIATLKANGIEPYITLHHFTFPRWARALGAWEWDGITEAFRKYAVFVYENIGPDVKDWTTINEPMVQLAAGYQMGIFPPGEEGEMDDLFPLIRNQLKSHAAAYHAMHEIAKNNGREIRIGLAHHLRTFDAAWFFSPFDLLAAGIADYGWNWFLRNTLKTGFLKFKIPFVVNINEAMPEVKGTQDIIGVNYYSGDLVHFNLLKLKPEIKVRKRLPVAYMDWNIYPEGLYRVIQAVNKKFPNLPIVITENGITTNDDGKKAEHIKDHLYYIHKAIKKGIPVEGYCYWSFLDNFEWAEGYDVRFGLYHVDYKTFERTIRPSGEAFKKIAGDNGFWR